MMISNPCCTTFRVLSEASGYFAFGVVPRTTCRPLGSRFNFSLQSSNLCRSLCYSSLTARATHSLVRTLYSVHGNRLSGLLNPRTCFQGSRNSTGLSEFCVSGETICLGERKTRQHKYSWPKKNTFPLFGAPISLLSAPSSREIFTCVSEGVWSKEAGGVLVGRLQSALTGWQPVRHKSRGKKSKYDDDEDSEEEELADDDYEAPPNFKKVQIFLKSLRADSVLSSALDISRNRVDEIFFGSRLRLNGEKLLKKSKQMEEGDYVDLVVERSGDDDQLLVKRVKVIHVSSERTNKDKIAVTVKVWKNAFPVQDNLKLEWK